MAAPNVRAGPVEQRSILSSRGLVHERNFQTKRVAHRLNCEAGRRSARAKVRLRTLGRWGGGVAGSLPFVVLHLVFLIGWLLVNSGKIPTIRPFDPYPFSLLGVIVAVEAVIFSSFILMRQNRMMRRGERRDHLNLQVDLLAEKEITKVLQMVRAICGHMGLQNIMADSEIRELSENTSIESLSQTLEDRLPGT